MGPISRQRYIQTSGPDFLFSRLVFSLIYVHFYQANTKRSAGVLPSYPDPRTRAALSLVVGEVHRQLVPLSSAKPRWLALPERGLYTGIAVFGSIGSGKTLGLILPAMRQLFAYKAQDAERKLSGIVLEVKGDLCRHLRKILKDYGREQDYVEVSLDGDLRYNPLNNALDPYAQAFNIASIITAIWGRGKEPFWQQSYRDLVRYVILLHRVRDGYITMVDIFRTVISSGQLEELLITVGSRFSMASYIGVSQQVYQDNRELLSQLGFQHDTDSDLYIAPWTAQLEQSLATSINGEFSVYVRGIADPEMRSRFESVQYWYWEHWKYFRAEVKTSIVQGIAVFLSPFETDPQVRRVFCPPKELYEGRHCADDPNGRVLPPFDELIESGAVVGLNFPVALNPALAKIIGTMMKVDYQRAVQLRIPRMDSSLIDTSVLLSSFAMSTRTLPRLEAITRPATNDSSPSPVSRSASPSLPRRASPHSKRHCPMKATELSYRHSAQKSF